MFLDPEASIPDDDELHSPHFGDSDYEDSQEPQEFDYDMYEGEDEE